MNGLLWTNSIVFGVVSLLFIAGGSNVQSRLMGLVMLVVALANLATALQIVTL